MFIDEVEIFVRSGKGGDGMVHFHREKYVPRGGPDGGDGGSGGDVIFEAVTSMNTLAVFRHKSRYIAHDGKNGGPNNMTGRSASHLVIKVPQGTMFFDKATGTLIGDLTLPGQKLIVCKGGRGGRGNQHFATAARQVPHIAEKGEPAQEKNLRLELRLIADVGIVGVPNAGKSSLLAALTNAHPKIGDYPFTTLEPNLGVVTLSDETSLVLADIPGLVEGAHMGVGLGDSFLRHIVRTRVLIHLLDGLSQNPLADFSEINNEMALYDPELARKPQLVAFNKMDQPEAHNQWSTVKEDLEKKGFKVFPISAVARTGFEPLLWEAAELVRTTIVVKAQEELPVYKPEEDPRMFTIDREADGWRVRGKAIERSAAMTYWEHDESIRRFQRIIETIGLDEALRKAGVEEGDTVYIGDYELEWQES